MQGGRFMGNKNLIITIEREYGSGGRIVGKKLAEELGIHFYDDDILKLASEKSAVGEQFSAWLMRKRATTCSIGWEAGERLISTPNRRPTIS